MEFAEEKTPSGMTLKIMYKKGMFLLFNEKGESIYADFDGRSLLHKTPRIVFIGTSFSVERDYDREYTLLKISEGKIILPYRDMIEKKRKYIFLETEIKADMIPSEIKMVSGYSSMLRDIPADLGIDYIITDSTITETEVAVITSRYKPGKMIINPAASALHDSGLKQSKEFEYTNVNTMSDNPVFLALMHLKRMSLSNLNQLLLDFDISALDIQYILYFIDEIFENRKNEPEVKKNINMLTDLKNAFTFYLALIQRDEETVKEKINSEHDPKKLSPYQTLVSKVRSMNPGRDDQLLFTEYENLVLERKEEIMSGETKK
ncbi:MAG TPA: hypothetical protein PK514_04440 [Spirochaetota bacterium]|nr:hypothetical protein [Spirochaetota bacterium]